MLTCLKKKVRRVGSQSRTKSQPRVNYLVFHGSEENYISNGAWVVEQSISLFHGKVNPVRHFSADELNNMNVETLPCHGLHRGSWEGIVVLVKASCGISRKEALREIVVATQMVTHNNAHKILGCCLETKYPVLVYEWVTQRTLEDCILHRHDDDQNMQVLKWKDRLRIAWEISHAISYLHTAFPRPIIYRGLNSRNVLLDEDNIAILSDFSLSVSIPEGEEFVVTDQIMDTSGYMSLENILGQVAESTDVYSFGMLFLTLLTGRRPYHYRHDFLAGEPNDGVTELVTLVRNGIKNKLICNIVDPAITSRNVVTTLEDLQLRASIELSMRCIAEEGDCRPTMVEVATEVKNMIRSTQGEGIYRIFQGSKENFIKNEAIVLDEGISLFHGRVSPIRYFSVDELNNMNVEFNHLNIWRQDFNWHQGSWEGRAVLVKLLSASSKFVLGLSREIVVATQMGTHNNVHKLLGCCLETKFPVLIYEWMAAETLEDRILLKVENQKKLPLLEWKDRLRIAWEISYAVSYFHTAFSKPIIHSYLQPDNVLLDQDNIAKLSNFSLCLSVPEDEDYLVEEFDSEARDSKWVAAECQHHHGRVAECADVYSFGVLFLMILTGKDAITDGTHIIKWVTEMFMEKRIHEIVDAKISTTGVANAELKAVIELALWCTTTAESSRPTMVDVACELYDMIKFSGCTPSTCTGF